MNQPHNTTIESLAARVATLERQNRRLRRSALLTLLAIGAGAAFGFAPTDPETQKQKAARTQAVPENCICEVIEGSSLRLRNPDNPYWSALLGGSDDASRLTLFTGSRGNVMLTTGYEGPGVFAWAKDPADGARAQMFVPADSGGPRLRFHGSNGFDRVELVGHQRGSTLELKDDRGHTRLRLVANRSGGRIEFLDDSGKLTNRVEQ